MKQSINLKGVKYLKANKKLWVNINFKKGKTMKNLLLTMLGLMAFVSVLFAGDEKYLVEIMFEKDPLFLFYEKYPEIKNEFKKGYLECVADNPIPALMKKAGYDMKLIELQGIAEGKEKLGKLASKEIEKNALYLLKGVFGIVSEKQAKKWIQEGYKDCNSFSDCYNKMVKQMLIVETDTEYCYSKFNDEIWENPNFMEKGTKWGDLYEDFKAEWEMKKIKERFK